MNEVKVMRRLEGAMAREHDPRRMVRLGRLWCRLLGRVKRRAYCG